MMQLVLMPQTLPEDPDLLLSFLADNHATLPFADEELDQHRDLRAKVEEQQRLSEQALSEWRAALARRWTCEVAGQRLYIHVQEQLSAYFGAGAPYLQLVAPTNHGTPYTAAQLLADLRRTEASLALLRPQPDFVRERLVQLTVVCNDLDEALDHTNHCECERRSAVLGHRLAQNAYERLCRKTWQRLSAYLEGEE